LPPQRRAFAEAAGHYWQVYRQTLGDLAWAGALEERAVRHTLACLLARVAGRSRLEYLSPEEKARQGEAVLALLPAPPATIAGLIAQFLTRL
jgi:hypothetical protein